tara:strand:+ start:3725 stop:4087 length:363 start_codon:yes stop_codon:yes gene_type:complete
MNNKALTVLVLFTCILSGYAASNSFLGTQYNEKQFERIDAVDKAITEQLVGRGSKEDLESLLSTLEKIVLKIEENSEEIQKLKEAENLLMKGYTELEFEGKIPEGLFINYGLRDVINDTR